MGQNERNGVPFLNASQGRRDFDSRLTMALKFQRAKEQDDGFDNEERNRIEQKATDFHS